MVRAAASKRLRRAALRKAAIRDEVVGMGKPGQADSAITRLRDNKKAGMVSIPA
jgi:hypothetical protein